MLVAIVGSIGIIVLYNLNFGSISGNRDDWASFGSVISGAFTLLGAFATIATLLFLYIQQSDNQDIYRKQEKDNLDRQQKHDLVIRKQMEALTFEQYLSHRKIFFERLKEQEFLLNHEIFFTNPDQLYNRIFSTNNPLNCDYKITIDLEICEGANDLNSILSAFRSLDEYLTKDPSDATILNLCIHIITIQKLLMFEYVDTPIHGDVVFFNKKTGLNLYRINKVIFAIQSVINSILFYTGNESVQAKSLTHNNAQLMDKLYSEINYSDFKSKNET